MNFNEKCNVKSTMSNDIVNVNDTFNTPTVNFINYSDYDSCYHRLDLDADNNFLHNKLAIANILLMVY